VSLNNRDREIGKEGETKMGNGDRRREVFLPICPNKATVLSD
jgi:hypothetical protein